MIAEQTNASKPMGGLNVAALLWVYIPTIIVTPFYCYYMAVSHHQEKPFPAATITSTACHYPQDIVFRFFMLIASSILALIFFLIFRWIKFVSDKVGYPKKLSQGLYYLSLFSILLYGVTIGTIDERSTGPLHSPCAVVFFVVLMILVIVMTLYLTDLRSYDTRTISFWSLKAKQALTTYVSACWIYCIIGLILNSVEGEGEITGKGDKYVVIVEWNTVAICLLWVLSFAWEWKHLTLILLAPSHSKSQISKKEIKR